MARARRTRFVRPAPKTKIWIGAGTASITLTSGAEKLMTVLNAAALALRPFTILRTRLDILFQSDQLTASEEPAGAYGRIVVTDQASGVGITALSAPIAEPDADWFVFQGMSTDFSFITAAGFDGGGGYHLTVDSKAMRKVGPNQDLVSVFELRGQGGANINVVGRTLVQLH